jgi:vacuolar protein sorting-associated protein 26
MLEITRLLHRLSHLSLSQVEFIGSIELVYGNEHEFVSLERELQPPGALTQPTTSFPFDFSAVEKVHESYNGMNVILRYFLRVTISRSLAPNITQELDIWVRGPAIAASAVTDFNPIKMEVHNLFACVVSLLGRL